MSEEKPTLRDYQIADLAFMMSAARTGLLHDPGGGKTPPVCVLLYWHWTQGRRSIWSMPKQLMQKNVDEILRFTHFKPEDVVIVDGTKPQVEAAIRSDAKVFIMGFERFKRSWRDLREAHPDIDVLAVDELHMAYANHDSARTQDLYEAMKKLTHFIPMTGTLIKGRLSSAYPTIHIIEPRYYMGFKDFMRQHGVYDLWDNLIGWKNHAKISEILGRHFIRRSFESIYGAEEKVIQTERIAMAPQQREAYEEFEKNAILELEDEFLTAKQGGVFTLRCRQIMQHPETFGLCIGEKSGKDQLLDIHLEDHSNSGEPLTIFACFIPEQERLYETVKAKGFRTALMNGNTSQKERVRIDQGFQAGTIDVVIGSPAVATVGYNWGHCDHCVYSSLDYGDDTFVQAYRRFIRGKRTKPLRISILEYARSIDQRLFRIVQAKSETANKVDETREVFNFANHRGEELAAANNR